MNWQLLLTLIIVIAAALYLGRKTWRTLRGGKSGCGNGCGCSAKKTTSNGDASLISAEQLVQRLQRKE